MYLQFHLPSSKLARKLFNALWLYQTKRYYGAYAPPFVRAGTLDGVPRGTVELVLSTYNTWGVCLSPPTLWYSGSRAGFHALTPFRSSPLHLEVEEGDLVIYDEQELKTYILQPNIIHSTHPALRWWERVEELHEQPGRAVVYSPYGHAERVIPYKNVYRSR